LLKSCCCWATIDIPEKIKTIRPKKTVFRIGSSLLPQLAFVCI
jgi:hypothetical protein